MTARGVSVLLMLCVEVTLSAQELVIETVDTTFFPRLSATIRVADEIRASDLTLTEDGVVRPLTRMDCARTVRQPVAVGVMVDTKDHIHLLRSGLHRLAAFLDMPASSMGITAMASGVQVVCELTSQREVVQAAIERVPRAPGTDVHTMFYDSVAGGLRMMRDARTAERLLFLITDLHCPVFNVNEDSLAANCRAAGVRVVTILLGTVDVTGMFRRLANATGGSIFEDVRDSVDVRRALMTAALQRTTEPCKIAWDGQPDCTPLASIDLALAHEQAHAAYVRPDRAIRTVDVYPSNAVVDPISHDATVSVQVSAGRVELHRIEADDPVFTVQAASHVIDPNAPISVHVRCTDTTDTYHVARCVIYAGSCMASFTVTSGIRGHGEQRLTVVMPNGGETLIAGTDTTVLWRGARDSVAVVADISRDGGATWSEIARRVREQHYRWTSVPRPASDRCLLRVRTFASVFDTITTARMTAAETEGISSLCVRGSTIYAAHEFTTVMAVDATTMESRQRSSVGAFDGAHPELARCTDVTRDGAYVVSVHGDGSARCWTSDLALHAVFSGHHSMIRHALFAPHGESIVTVSEDTTLYVHDVRDGAQRSALRPHRDRINGVAWRPDGRYIVTCGRDSSFVVSDAYTGRVAWRQALDDMPTCCAWDPSGQRLAVGTTTSVSVWDMSTRDRVARCTPPSEACTALVWNGSGNRLVVVSPTYASVWEPSNGRSIGDAWSTPSMHIGARLLPGGEHVALATRTDIAIVECATGRRMHTIDARCVNGVTAIDVGATDTVIYTGGRDGRIHAWTLPSVTPLQEDVSDNTWRIAAPLSAVGVRHIVFDRLRIGSERDSTIRGIVQNTGTAAMQIRSIVVRSGNDADFLIRRGGEARRIAPGASTDVDVTFRPTASGIRQAIIEIVTADTLLQVMVTGIGVEMPLQLAAQDIDVGLVEIGRHKDTLVRAAVRNTADTTVVLTSPVIHGASPSMFHCQTTGLVLPPGAACDVTVRYTPASMGKSTALLTFSVQGSDVSVTLRCIGAGRKTETTTTTDHADDRRSVNLTLPAPTPRRMRLVCSTAEAAPGDEVAIVVRLHRGITTEHSKQAVVTAALRFNASMLVPTDDSMHGSLNNTDRIVPITFAAADSIVVLHAMATLGTDTTTVVAIEQVKIDGGRTVSDTVDIENGAVHLTGVCKVIGARLFDPAAPPITSTLWPNPVTTDATLRVDHGIQDIGDAEVFDANGRSVALLATPVRENGITSWQIRASLFTAGTYTVMVHHASGSIRQSFIVAR